MRKCEMVSGAIPRWKNLFVDYSLAGDGRVSTTYQLTRFLAEMTSYCKPAGDLMLQRLALEVLHGNERPAVPVVNFVNRTDIWMV
jgi:hypothetical protein